jgi:two-component system, LuxR family, sensor kinase FixL
MNSVTEQSKFEELRHRAEDLIERCGRKPHGFSDMDMLSLIHELEVHQIELQVQNEELLQARRELEESRTAYRELYDLAPIGYVTVNAHGTIVNANLMASDMLRSSRKDLIGRALSSFIHLEDHATYFALFRNTVEKDEGAGTGDIRLLRPVAKPFHARVEISPALDGDGRFSGWRIVFGDITNLKLAEEELKSYATRLEFSNRELQDFAFVASHDLQEPLRKIQVFGDRLEQKFASALGPEGNDYLKRMCKAANRLQQMVHGLLDYSRIMTEDAVFAPVDLQQVVREVVSDLEWQIENSGGTVTTDFLPTVVADPHQMRRLFQNLISNALKFHTEERSIIRIYSNRSANPNKENEEWRIFVEDNGIGFDEKHSERIFSLFERLHGRSAYEGTGMGLAICRRIVQRHGGTITARATPGRGATFIITLPTLHRNPV